MREEGLGLNLHTPHLDCVYDGFQAGRSIFPVLYNWLLPRYSALLLGVV